MPSDTEEQAGRRGFSSLWVLIVVGGGFFFGWFVVPLAEDYPLLNPPGRLFSISLFIGTFVAVGAAVLWLRRKKPASAARPAVEWVVSIGASLFFGVVAALVSTLWMFPILNGALDFGPATRSVYTVVEFVPEERDASGDCLGSRTILSGDDSHYLLAPRAAQSGDGQIMVGVSCDDERGLPTDGGDIVPVEGEVVAEVKPGFFGRPWLAGLRSPPGG